jgi:hypothetical protein
MTGDDQGAFGGHAALVAAVVGVGLGPLLGGEVAADDDGLGEAQGLDEQPGALDGLARAAQGLGHGVVGGGDTATGAGVGRAGVGGRDVDQGVRADLGSGALLLALGRSEGR